ncbi:MAG: Crp/Fnr family transcriptional regulator [Flavipsychrobacter sp.]|nr:Crp/Fnr family transcriptional regulator [Flavipsychrobacter sp.]
MSSRLQDLQDFLYKLHPLSRKTEELISQYTNFILLKKGAYLFKPGMDHRTLYFLVKGVVRGYRKYKGEEITTWLNEEGEMITSISNIGLDQECEEYIQTLTECELIGIPADKVDFLFANCSEIPVITKLLLEDNYRGAEERAFISRIPSAEEKYFRFVEKHPGLINRIPLKYSASYLGMRLETLCRIRSKRVLTT